MSRDHDKRALNKVMLWLLDWIVAVFIGPVDAGKRAWKVRQMAARRGMYALAFAGVLVLAATVYTLAVRWTGIGT